MDDNQTLYSNSVDVASLIDVKPFYLQKNVRNTQSIFYSSVPFYKGRTSKCIGPAGPVVRVVHKRPKDQAAAVKKELTRTINAEDIDASRIAVLSFSAIEKSCVSDKDLEEFLPVRADVQDGAGGIVHDSVWRFKGLERSVVILTDIEEFTENTELLYVAFSRARVMLIVFAEPRVAGRLQAVIQNATAWD